MQGSDKREGAGQGNWGTEKDELKGQTEAVTDEKPSEENAEAVAAPAPVVEEEEKTLTLEEYLKQKKSIVKNSNAKVVASAETEQKEVRRMTHGSRLNDVLGIQAREEGPSCAIRVP